MTTPEARHECREALRRLDARTLLRLEGGTAAPAALPGVPRLVTAYGERAVGVWVGVHAGAELAGRGEGAE